MTFTIGADPEVFFKRNGRPISAHTLLPGTKKEPHKTERGAIQVDGTAGEFNIDPVPFTRFEDFNLNIVHTMRTLRDMANREGSVSLAITPVQEYDKEYLDSLPESAKELGCDPDFCAYTMEKNPRPDEDIPFRTGSGHIHIGWGADIPVDNEDHMKICADFIKVMDATVGMFMTYIDRDPRRRELYGKAGAFRPKPYGVEYRTPSNVWLRNRDYREMVFMLTNRAINKHKAGQPIRSICGYDSEAVQDIINNGHVLSAETAMDQYLTGYPVNKAIWEKIRKQVKKNV